MKKYLPLLAFVSLLPLSAHAGAFKTGNFYGSVGGGVAIPQNTSASLSGAITGSGNYHFKDGWSANGILGYHFTDFLAGEAELEYSRVKFDKLSGTLTAGLLGAGSGDIGIDGHAQAFTGLVNGLVTPFNAYGVSPYLGGGVGFASTKTHINSLTFAGTTFAADSGTSKTYFAADGIAGFDARVNDYLSLGGRYQYLWINSASSDTSSGVTEKDGNFKSHVLTAQAVFKF
jgi:outer membrane protein W